MAIKSDFLIHWTGKDISQDIIKLTDTQRNKYLERLKTTCKTGLWMTPYSGELHGLGSTQLISFSNVTCFTENRKEYYLDHAQKYGLMGFGFKRNWILDRDGIPVIYLKNDANDLQTSLLTQAIITLSKYRDDQGNPELSAAYYNLSLIIDYAKSMSDKNVNDYQYLEDAEWRICWHSFLPKNSLIKKTIYRVPRNIISRLLQEN